MAAGTIRVGIGGWTYEPWRGTFFPPKLPQARELEYAAQRVTAIEINGTYYRLQTAESFEKWAAATPDGFIFSVKASRYCTNRTVLAEAGESVGKFLDQGLTALGDKLGPILWQFAPTKRFDPDDFDAFLKLLPAKQDGVPLRHAVEARHESFVCPEFMALAKAAGVAIVFADSADYPMIDEATADFTYARLQQASEAEPAGYGKQALDGWADKARGWAKDRDVFVFIINGAKVRAPAAAQALIERL